VYDHGTTLAYLDARSAPAEEWVRKVAVLSGQRVDWHYFGGRAHVMFLGNHAKAVLAVLRLQKELDGKILSLNTPTSLTEMAKRIRSMLCLLNRPERVRMRK
jgi:hypothetical protein